MTTNTPSVAVIGCGGWGKNIVRTLGELNALGAIYDANPLNPHAGELAARFHVPFHAEADGLAAALAAGHKAIAIVTTDRDHANAVAVALRHGVDVFVEKPLSLNLIEATTLLNDAAARGAVLMTGHLLRYHPSFLAVQEAVAQLLASHADARIASIASVRHDSIEAPRDTDLVAGYAPHDVSLVVGLLGDQLPVTEDGHENYSDAAAQVRVLSTEGNPHRHIMATLEVAGVEVMLDLAWDQPRNRRFQVAVHAGAQLLGTVVWSDEFVVTTTTPDAGEVQLAISPQPPLTAELAHFIECVDKRLLPLTSGEETRRVTWLLQLLDQAYFIK